MGAAVDLSEVGYLPMVVSSGSDPAGEILEAWQGVARQLLEFGGNIAHEVQGPHLLDSKPFTFSPGPHVAQEGLTVLLLLIRGQRAHIIGIETAHYVSEVLGPT